MVYEIAVLIHILIIYNLICSIEIMSYIGTHTNRMVFRDLPVYTSCIYHCVVAPSHSVRTCLQECLAAFIYIFKSAILPIVHVAIISRTKHVNTILAIVKPQFALRSVEVILQILFGESHEVKSKTITLMLLCAYAHHCPYRGIILRTGIVDNLNITYFITT